MRATTTHCLNCAAALPSSAKFCATCGQKALTHRLSFHDIWHDAAHAFTHADKGFLLVLVQMLRNPGLVVSHYIAGKRVRYFSPFTFLLIIVGFATLAITGTHFMEGVLAGSQQAANPVTVFINRHINIIILANVPILALYSKLLFKNQVNYAEALVLAAYTSGIRSFIFTLVIAPLWYFFHTSYAILLGSYTVVWYLYFAYTCAGTFTGGKWPVFLKGLAVAFVTHLTTIAIISGSFFIYFWLVRSK